MRALCPLQGNAAALFTLHNELPLQISLGEIGVFHLPSLHPTPDPEFANCRTRGSLAVLPAGMLPVCSLPLMPLVSEGEEREKGVMS